MSADGCGTDGNCCYQDDSGAGQLRNLCVGLGVVLVLALLALSWVTVTWRRSSAIKSTKDVPVLETTPSPPAAGIHGIHGIQDKHEKGTGSTTSTPQDCRILGPVQNPRAPDEELGEMSEEDGEREEGQEQEQEQETQPRLIRTTSHLSLRSWRSLRSLRSATSLDNLEFNPHRSCPAPAAQAAPASPASTVAQEDINRLRFLLDSERSRRVAAESVLSRRSGTPSSVGTSSSRMSLRTFPSSRAVERHALEATENAARWVQSTITRAGVMKPELPFLVTRVLAHVFGTSRAEIRKRLNARVEGLRAFIGGGEEVQLGRRGDGMTAETRELLYDELQKRYRTIAAVGRQELVTISARVLSRALKTEELRELGRTVVHRTWPSFEPLLRSYLALFVECQLQQPEVTFEDLFVGREEAFNPDIHRELARFREPKNADTGVNRNGTCCVVFPAIIQAKARIQPSEAARGGVIMWSEDYFKP